MGCSTNLNCSTLLEYPRPNLVPAYTLDAMGAAAAMVPLGLWGSQACAVCCRRSLHQTPWSRARMLRFWSWGLQREMMMAAMASVPPPNTMVKGAYAAILVLGPPARDDDGCDGVELSTLSALLEPQGALA